MSNPIELFRAWFAEARAACPLRHPGAVCVSTVDLRGAPDARFVDLKEVTDEGFVFCSRFDSPKGVALARDPRVALTFWWDQIQRQVRVTGTVLRLVDTLSEEFFRQRPRGAQLVSCVSQQSEPLQDLSAIEQRIANLDQELTGAPVPRPETWGGYLVIPQRVEFLTFRSTRMHERRLFSKTDSGWDQTLLAP